MLWAVAAALLVGPSEGVSLTWRAPMGCPDEARGRQRIEQLLGRGLDEVAPQLAIRVEIDVTGEELFELRFQVERGGQDHERTAQGRSCEALTDAAVLMAAIAIDPTIGGAPPQQQRPPKAPSGPLPALPLVPDPSPPAPRRQPAAVPRLALGASVGVGAGALPGAEPGLAGHAGLLWRRARVDLGGRYWFERRRAVAQGEALFDLWTVAATACGRVELARRVELPLCAGARAGQMRGRTRGLVASTRQTAPWIAVAVAPGFAFAPVRRFAILASLEGWVALTRPRFAVSGVEGTVHRPAPVVLRAWVGFEARIP